MSNIAPTGRSLLDDTPAPAKSAPREPAARSLTAARITIDGEDEVVRHDTDVLAAKTARMWGEEYVVFADGKRLRADAIRVVEPLTLEEAEARAKEAEKGAPMPTVLVAQAGPSTAMDPALAAEVDLGISEWTDEQVQDAIDAMSEIAKTDVAESLRRARMAGALQKRREARGQK